MEYPLLDVLAYWINNRWAIYQKKEEQNQKPPWTTDPYLSQYRYCNVHRENDRVTRWIAKHWREPNADDPNLWHGMLVARMINWPPTLEYIGYPSRDWFAARVLNQLEAWRDSGNKVFTGAYTISTNGVPMDKLQYVVDVWENAYRQHHNWSPVDPTSLAITHANLTAINAVGSFIAAQVIADLKHTPHLANARDKNNWAAPGPGSMRGLNRLKGLDLGRKWRNPEFSEELMKVRAVIEPQIEWVPDLCLQDLQNCLCEFDKYVRLRDEGGRVRAKYKPHTYPL